MNFPTIDAMCRSMQSGFIGALPMSGYVKRMELAEMNRRIPPTPTVVKQECGVVVGATTDVVPYVSTPMKAYDIKEEPRTPTGDDIEDTILWAIAADIEEANEVAEAVATLRVDDAKREFMNFVATYDTDDEDVVPPPPKKRLCRALTF